MKGIISFFGGPLMWFILIVIIAIVVAVIIFGVNADMLLGWTKSFAPK